MLLFVALALAAPPESLDAGGPSEPVTPLDEAPWLDVALAAAVEHLGERPAAVALEPRVLTFAGGRRARIRYRLHGLPVVGSSLVVASSPGGPMRVSGGSPVWPIAPDKVPTVDRSFALAQAAAVSSSIPRAAELAWYPDGDSLRLAWRVPVHRPHGAVPSPHDLWLDAHDGHQLALLPAGHAAEALVYPENPVTSDVERWALLGDDLSSVYAQSASCTATDPDPSVLELAACELVEHQAQPDADGNYLFVPRPDADQDPFSEVGAFVHIDRMSAWLDERWGFRQAWAPIDVFVNFPLANAFFGDFDGDGKPDVSFGHTRGMDYAYDADVVYHELGHAVVNTLAPDLPFLQADEQGLDWVSGSINEGSADAFAMILTDDPLMAEYAGGAYNRSAIRDLQAVHTCPDDLLGEVHADGEIFGSLFWQLIDDEAVGADLAAELLMGSIALWDADPSWPKVGASLQETAADLLDAGVIDDGAHGVILGHIEASGIAGCDRIAELGPGGHKELDLVNPGLIGELERFVGNVQLRIDPRDAPIAVEVVKQGSHRVGWSAFVRYGAPVEHEVLDVAGLGLTAAIPKEYDELLDGTGTGPVATFSPEDGPVYVMFAARNISIQGVTLTYMTLDVEATAVAAAEPYRHVEPKPLRHETSCSTSSPAVGSLLGLVGLLCARRRR